MSGIPSTVSEFNRDLTKFMKITGNKSSNPDSVRGAKKCIALRYIGLTDASTEQREVCAMHLQIALSGAISRGWILD
jgi:hypothetical protein